MKIVHIITTLGYGGAEKICMDLCNELAASEEHEVHLISLFDHTPEQRPLEYLNKNIYFHSTGKKPGLDFRVLSRVNKTLKTIRPDVVHTHLTGLFFSLFYIWNHPKVRFIHTVHNLAKKDVHPLFNAVNKILIRRKRVVPVALSQEILRSVQDYFKVKDVYCIYNGTVAPVLTARLPAVSAEVERYKRNPTTRVFINLGRIHPQKNQEMLVRVFNRLQEKNVTLLILGECTDKNRELLIRLKKMALPHIHILGKKDNPSDYLYLAEAFCLSSSYEGLPIALLEALALGKVPICTPVGALPSVVNSDMGILSSSDSEAAYYEAICNYLQLDDNRLNAMSANCKTTFFKTFTIQACAEAYLRVYSAKGKP